MVKLFVARLDYSVTKEELSAFFGRFGSVQKLTIPTDKETGKSRGFAFIEILADDAESIIQATDGQTLNGRQISVKQSEDKPRNERESQERGSRPFNRSEQSRPSRPSRSVSQEATSSNEERIPFASDDDSGKDDPIIHLEKSSPKKKVNKKGKNSNVDRLSDGSRKLKMNAYKKKGKNNFFDYDDDDY